MNLTRRVRAFLLCATACALFLIATAPVAFATPILGIELGTFAVLGAQSVTNTGPTTLTGNYGVSPGTSLGLVGVTLNGVVHQTNPFANTAQTQLGIALGLLGGLAPTGTVLGGVLNSLVLNQGIYAVSAAPGNGGFNLSTNGVLTLNAQNMVNPFWVFNMSSTLITGSGSVVQFINAPAGFNPSLYWNVGSSATLGTTTSFQGNILALTSISLNTGATIGCGSALAHTGGVTLQSNTISIGCNGPALSIQTGSGGVPVVVGPSGTPVATPEPTTLVLLGIGIAGFVARWPRFKAGQQLDSAPKA